MKLMFVDGYNIINSWPNLKTIKDYSLDDAREKLIDKMHNYSVYVEIKVIIVFDGYKVSGNLERQYNKYSNIVVVFTKDGETADSYIEREVHNYGRRTEIYVVTSDNLEQQTIFQRGANRISSIELYNDVLAIEAKIRKKTEKNIVIDKNHLQDNVNEDVLKKLEKIRRS